MFTHLKPGIGLAMLALTLAPAYAQSQKVAVDLTVSKEALHAQMRDLAQMIDQAKANQAPAREIEALQSYLQQVSDFLGGDLPAAQAHGGHGVSQATSQSGVQQLTAPACAGGALTTTNYPGIGGTILPVAPAPFLGSSFTCNVSGAGTYLWDVNLSTFITHTASNDLDITLTSPAGTVVTITTDNGGTNDNCFNGTLWDDNVNPASAADFVYANNVTATPLAPEGRLAAFRGEDPNGTWTLKILDDLTANSGTLNSWALDITTATAPVESTTGFTQLPGLVIPTTIATVTDTVAVSGVGTYLTKATVALTLPHTYAGDLDITLTSPAGTIVQLTTDNGVGNDNVFNGTVFDPDAATPVTDVVFANNVNVVTCSPEGSFDNFLGQDPNGNWTLTVADDAGGDGGTLVSWTLNLTTTGGAPTTAGPTNFAGASGAILDFPTVVTPPVTPTVFTLNVSGAGTSLWDVDLNTTIAHTSSADLDMTLTSPAGTVVTISTDNGGTNDNCFNGTLWDDNDGMTGSSCVDFVYTNNVAAASLSPEGRFDNFRGEDPNGTWTLTITDDATGADYGTLNAWSLDLSTLASAPAEVSTTYSNLPGTAIPTTAPPFSTSDVIAASGLGTSLTEVEVFIQVPHTYAGDLDITLTSPAGTIVQLTTDNGAGNDNVFNGTLFDADASAAVTDYVFVNNVTVPALQSEGALGAFKGQDPNGNWTLTIADDASGDGGTFVRWDLTLRTCNPAAFNSFCAGDGTLADHTTPCPCGNNGAAGNGCANSVNANGANLVATGTPALDDVVLNGSGMPLSVSCIYLQGTATDDVVFGDGVRCTGGSLLRLRTKTNVGGASSFPDSVETVTLSQRGGVTIGSGVRRYYQTYYRNSAALFCPPETFNVTNGWVIDW
ncbi:MAG: proprotein convertase P-domain-containing protein [Planctomycetota bacterium]